MEKNIKLNNEESITQALSNNSIDLIKKELQKNVEFSKKLTITDLEDKKQFQVVKDTKNWYVKTRNSIKRAFKSKRDEYNKLAKDNLSAEKEVIAVIEWEENRLNELVQEAELAKLKKDNESKLEPRKELLKEYECELKDEELLIMTDKDFKILLSEKKELYLEKKEAELKAEQEKIKREKELEEARKQAKIEAEQEAERKHKQEIEKIKREQEEKEILEKQKLEKEKQAKIEAEKIEKEKQERLEKEKKYITYRDSIDYDKFEKEDWKIIFYKKVGEFII